MVWSYRKQSFYKFLLLLIALYSSFNFEAHAAVKKASKSFFHEINEEYSHLRFVNASPGGISDIKSQIDLKGCDITQFKCVTAYKKIKSGQLSVTIGSKKHLFQLAPGKKYTIALIDKFQVFQLQDEKLKFQAKSLLGFYNFSNYYLSLKMQGRNINIVDKTKPNQNRFREINPAEASLEIFNVNSRKGIFLEPLKINAGENCSIFAFEVKGKIQKNMVCD